MAFEARYPVGLTTNVWQPGKNPAKDGTSHVLDLGVREEIMGDGASTVGDKVGPTSRRYVFSFQGVSLAALAAFEAFLVVIESRPFDIREDPDCGYLTDWTTVKLTGDGFKPEIHRGSGGTFVLVLPVRTIP